MLYRWLYDSIVDDYCYLNEMILAVQCSFSLSSILCAHTHTHTHAQNTNAGAYVHTYTQTHIHKFAYAPTHSYCTAKNTVGEKTLASLVNYSISSSLFANFHNFHNIPYENGLKFAKVFLPNCLQSLFAKVFYGTVYIPYSAKFWWWKILANLAKLH